ncbi:hypothetical protein SERLA73DRAFT_47627 [Serpula lacrymans var. lacrymans S7.3]|uniref:Mediator of RNA polymerase II transcription subunit 6 n=2 Tax=Serpula lacrymans var. lacrymans TaxID=341189 RepID=F8PM97_SERL3|nr:uncharacterized protein SERLADRAFT_366138 [Serpula lacrymans var. lacrymans S7.9]EGO02729.1 hypothetical protein SERLA73DRAFT_47627 [Serpula lacrymans var. lacrymans S7.3]EGO28429.1 hypothetical protein SERLADRAFT_366138 [Serpula lacrymans var. lacrymans S7.9]
MDNSDLHPLDDYTHRFFIWHEWIQANGPLTVDNVFDYFATSMFYDKQSNNQVLRMQTMHIAMPILNEAEELKRFTGIEFALVHAHPPSLFIIHKRERLSPEEVRPLAAYFVVNNRIYQSPDVYTVLSNRLLTSLYSLQSSLDILRSYRPDYTPRTGFVWPVMDPSLVEGTNKNHKSQVDPIGAASQQDLPPFMEKPKAAVQKKQNDSLMLNAMRTTAVHSNASFSSRVLAIEAESVPDTPVAGPSQRLSTTPAPSGTRDVTPKATSNAPTPRDANPARVSAGAGKKKKKRGYN